MKILGKYGKEDLAILYIAKMENGKILEFVESIQPPIPREEKWVLIISTMYGCPVGCLMCDAGEYYQGNVTTEDMFLEIDHIIHSRYPELKIPIPKLKIQFARMGEPTLNKDVLKVLKDLPRRYNAPGLMPCISTVAPNAGKNFLYELIDIKDKLYKNGNFQLQFSIHSTNENERKKWMTENIWTLNQIALYGEEWYKQGDRKITLNFAVSEESIIDVNKIKTIFNPDKYWIKVTPINPTNKAVANELQSAINEENSTAFPLVQEFRDEGYEAMLSIGEWEENMIGTNCGQFATSYQKGRVKLKENYKTTEYTIEH